jgi:hypothetical protein
MRKAVRSSEMSVYFKETAGRYIPEGCHLRKERSWRRTVRFNIVRTTFFLNHADSGYE